jgi:hypothetical protein
MSVRRLGHEVRVRPDTTPASTSDQAAWQIAATGFPASKNPRTNVIASSSVRRASGLATPPGSTSPSKSAGSAFDTGTSTSKVSALSRWWNACTVPASGETSFGVPPARSTACQGSVSSTCSIPSAATRKATVLPWSASDAPFVMLFLLCSFFDYSATDPYRTSSAGKRREDLHDRGVGGEDLTVNRTVQVAVTKPLSETGPRGTPGDLTPEPESAGGVNDMKGLA